MEIIPHSWPGFKALPAPGSLLARREMDLRSQRCRQYQLASRKRTEVTAEMTLRPGWRARRGDYQISRKRHSPDLYCGLRQTISCTIWRSLMKSCGPLLLASVLSLFSSPLVHAALVIDTFDTPMGTTVVPHGFFMGVAGGPAPEAIGGHRLLVAQRTVDNGTVAFNVAAGELSLAVSPNEEGVGSVTWGSNDPNGLGLVDLTQGGTNQGFLFSMSTGATKLEMMVESGGVTRTAVIPNPVGPLVFLPFASFPAGADFTMVKRLDFFLTAANGGSATVDFIQAGIPEPATQVMALVLCVCMGATRRR